MYGAVHQFKVTSLSGSALREPISARLSAEGTNLNSILWVDFISCPPSVVIARMVPRINSQAQSVSQVTHTALYWISACIIGTGESGFDID